MSSGRVSWLWKAEIFNSYGTQMFSETIIQSPLGLTDIQQIACQ